jgi:hypothetical protein
VFPLIERAAYLSVSADLPLTAAVRFTVLADELGMYHREAGSQLSHSPQITAWYTGDGAPTSGESTHLVAQRSVPGRFGCNRLTCIFCDGKLLPANRFSNEPIGADEMLKDPAKRPRLFTSSVGAMRCIEYTRCCSACGAIHGCSQAWKDGTMGVGNDARHYPLNEIEVLRVTELSFFEIDAVYHVLFYLSGAHVTAHAAARLMSPRGRGLGDPPDPLCNPQLLRHAELLVLVLWWLFEVGCEDPCKTNLASVLQTVDGLDRYIERETVLVLLRHDQSSGVVPSGAESQQSDNSEPHIGLFHKLMMKWAMTNPLCDHPDCGTGLIMDGNQDVVAKTKHNKRQKQSEEQHEKEREDKGGGVTSFLQTEVEVEEVEVEESLTGSSSGEESDELPGATSDDDRDMDQGWPPLVRKVLRCTADELQCESKSEFSAADASKNFNLSGTGDILTGMVFHRTRGNVHEVHFPHGTNNPTLAWVVSCSGAFVSAHINEGEDKVPWCSVDEDLLGYIEWPEDEPITEPDTPHCCFDLSEVSRGARDARARAREQAKKSAAAAAGGGGGGGGGGAGGAGAGGVGEEGRENPPLVGLGVQQMEHDMIKGEVGCANKSKQKIKKKFEATNHIQVVSGPCRMVYSVVEHETFGEGATWNCLQLEMMIEYQLSLDPAAIFQIRLFIDDACSTLVHLYNELAKFARGKRTVLKTWVLLMLIAIDICVDGFHIRNHKEKWCRILLNPANRGLPENWNTQAGEQNFQEIVKYVGPLREMKRGRHRFVVMSLYMMWNMRLSKTPMNQRDTVRNRIERAATRVDKHKMREEARKRQLSQNLTSEGKSVVRGRFAVPKDYVKKFPRGFPEGLDVKYRCGCLHHTHVPIALFKDNETFLRNLVMKHITSHNQSSGRKFAAAGALKQWLLDKLVEQNPYIDMSKPSKPGVFTHMDHTCHRC